MRRLPLLAAMCMLMLALSGCGLLDTLIGQGTTPLPSVNPADYEQVKPEDFVANPQAYLHKKITLNGPIEGQLQIDSQDWQIKAQLASASMYAYTETGLTPDEKWMRVYFELDTIDPRKQVQGGYRNVWLGNEALFVGRPDRLDLLAAQPSAAP